MNSRVAAAVLAALPGLLLMMLVVVWELAPTHGDLTGYFAPLRERTAEVLAGARGPFWNPDVGCGEPYFANPQTAILYPPCWISAWVGAHRGLGLEAGLHLVLLGVGSVLLAHRLGADPAPAAAAGLGVCLAGPTADAVGVLNNIETLTWAPWVWLASISGRPILLAPAFACAWLGGEPLLVALIGGAALALAPTRRTVIGLSLGLGLVAVQILPFLFWVLDGSRGAGSAVGAPSGGMWLSDIAALVVPRHPLAERPDVFLHHPYQPLWGVIFGVAAAASRRPHVRRLASIALLLLLVPVAVALPGGEQVWAFLTRGLVRFPARLPMLATMALMPAAAAVVGTLARRRRRTVLGTSFAAALLVIFLPGDGPIAAAGALAAGLALAGAFTGVAVCVGSVILAAPFAAVLGLHQPPPAPPPLPCAAHQADLRVFTLQLSWDQLGWVREDSDRRGRLLGYGYLGLGDGRRMVRTFAPLSSKALAEHLTEADRGPPGRWWLDALAAPRLVVHHPVHGFPLLCAEDGVIVLDNPRAFAEVQVTHSPPQPNRTPQVAGTVSARRSTDDHVVWHVTVEEGGGFLVRSASPDRGWRYTVDGIETAVSQGRGILSALPLGPGEHTVEARYRPPGLVIGGLITLLCIGGTVMTRRIEGQHYPFLRFAPPRAGRR